MAFAKGAVRDKATFNGKPNILGIQACSHTFDSIK
jgi:hypothetical protein